MALNIMELAATALKEKEECSKLSLSCASTFLSQRSLGLLSLSRVTDAEVAMTIMGMLPTGTLRDSSLDSSEVDDGALGRRGHLDLDLDLALLTSFTACLTKEETSSFMTPVTASLTRISDEGGK